MSREELLRLLTRYEGAIQRDNDESDDASAGELEEVRKELMDFLMKVKDAILK